MKRSIAELITRDPEKFAHHDRVFKNNPVVMQGMGLAPLVVLATTGKNALMLAVAVALLLTPSRMLACLVSRPRKSWRKSCCPGRWCTAAVRRWSTLPLIPS